ncbi:MAG: D-alanine--D-alanine ligase family protein, partial [Tepidisphaeraceae bacterium]
ERHGLPTPHWCVAHASPAGSVRGPGRMSVPCVVKPISSGSSIDVFVCRTESECRAACDAVLRKYGQALCEKYVDGIEVTVGILDQEPLSPIRITTSHAFFDYAAKYAGNDARHEFDLGISDDLLLTTKALARQAHEVIGCRDLSRVDMMISGGGKPHLLEINTMPGFTPRSLLPEAAAHDGIPFPKLVDRLVRKAHSRGARARAA